MVGRCISRWADGWDELGPLVGVAWLFAGLIVVRHRANIGRLMKGTEPKIGRREIEKAKM